MNSKRLLLICGCLEPEKDGIGDYSRILAQTLAQSGNKCLLASFGDTHINEDVEYHGDESADLWVIRYKHSLQDASTAKSAKELISKWLPSLILLQYNPYCYHIKGLPWYLPRSLNDVLGSTPVCIIFHELWNSFKFPIALKSKFYSPFQKLIISRLKTSVNLVGSLTTSNYYRMMLKLVGINAMIAPVYSNIQKPTSQELCPSEIESNLRRIYQDHDFVIVIFGNQWTHPDKAKISKLNTSLSLSTKKSIIIAVGIHSEKSIKTILSLHSGYLSSFPLHFTGPLGGQDLAFALSSSTIAITTYPYELANKSGAIAAILDNGTPVYFIGQNLSKGKELRLQHPVKGNSLNRIQASIRLLDDIMPEEKILQNAN